MIIIIINNIPAWTQVVVFEYNIVNTGKALPPKITNKQAKG